LASRGAPRRERRALDLETSRSGLVLAAITGLKDAAARCCLSTTWRVPPPMRPPRRSRQRRFGRITAAGLWERIGALYARLIPAADEAGVNVTARPDDPPEREYRGVEQALNSVDGLRRLTELAPSARNGLLLCLASLRAMGDDTMAAIEEFVGQGQVFGVLARGVRGSIPSGGYQETFLDEGDLDMLQLMRLLARHDFAGPIIPWHPVGITGDTEGRISLAWDLGYLRALRAAVQTTCPSVT
jgi:mannonate dehydratase